MQITENTLIIGVDIAKRKHVARAIDDHGRDLVKRLMFEDFKDLLTSVETLKHVERHTEVLIGMEPTGYCWLNLDYYLKDIDSKVVVVNPSMEFKTLIFILLEPRVPIFFIEYLAFTNRRFDIILGRKTAEHGRIAKITYFIAGGRFNENIQKKIPIIDSHPSNYNNQCAFINIALLSIIVT